MSSNPPPQKLIQGPPHRLLCFQSPDVVVDDRVEECTCISGTQNASVVDTLLLQEHCKNGGTEDDNWGFKFNAHIFKNLLESRKVV